MTTLLDPDPLHVPPPHHYAIRNGKRVCLDCPGERRRGWGVLAWCALGVAFWVAAVGLALRLSGVWR